VLRGRISALLCDACLSCVLDVIKAPNDIRPLTVLVSFTMGL